MKSLLHRIVPICFLLHFVSCKKQDTDTTVVNADGKMFATIENTNFNSDFIPAQSGPSAKTFATLFYISGAKQYHLTISGEQDIKLVDTILTKKITIDIWTSNLPISGSHYLIGGSPDYSTMVYREIIDVVKKAYYNNTGYTGTSIPSGLVTIQECDTNSHAITGTFNFSGKSSNGVVKTVSIGSFKKVRLN